MTKDVAYYKRFIEFLDSEGFTANYRKGHWYYQHYHDPDMVQALLSANGFTVQQKSWRRFGDSWQCQCSKTEELPREDLISAVEYEFNLPLPHGGSFNRHQDVMRVMQHLWEGW